MVGGWLFLHTQTFWATGQSLLAFLKELGGAQGETMHWGDEDEAMAVERCFVVGCQPGLELYFPPLHVFTCYFPISLFTSVTLTYVRVSYRIFLLRRGKKRSCKVDTHANT